MGSAVVTGAQGSSGLPVSQCAVLEEMKREQASIPLVSLQVCNVPGSKAISEAPGRTGFPGRQRLHSDSKVDRAVTCQ